MTLVDKLIKKGVTIPCPSSVEIDPEIHPDRIAPGVIIHTGCKLRGAATAIGPGCAIGTEAPATVSDCQLGKNVILGGGYFQGVVFLEGAGMGSCAHIRAGTILEEQASGAHSVGLKQTILLPFVTLGSIINFCDILMAGGTDRRNHSEVGSSYIHFNFTPHQDKATPSLVGDVPRGVMLDRSPIFLGGQGGLVGPARIEYGTVIAAGVIYRKDIIEPDKIHMPGPHKALAVSFRPGLYKGIGRIVRNNLIYIGNIKALQWWYLNIRSRFISDKYDRYCFDGALKNLDEVLNERIKRLEQLAEKFRYSVRQLEESSPTLPAFGLDQQNFSRDWQGIKEKIKTGIPSEPHDSILKVTEKIPAGNYLEVIKSLAPDLKKDLTAHLQTIVDNTTRLWYQ